MNLRRVTQVPLGSGSAAYDVDRLVASATRIALALFVLWAARPGVAKAASLDATWNGGAANWSTASQWSGGVVPNNGGGNTFNVFIDGAQPITARS